ncbi:MAG: simple sugar transport system permease protein, partial [bacterium]
MTRLARAVAWPLLAVLAGLLAAALLAALAGENPLHVLSILFRSAFGSSFGFGYTLYYATPLLLAGLAVALPYRAGLFNIGAEGQLLLGSAAVAGVATHVVGLSPWIAVPLGILAAAAAGGAWGLL